MQRLDPDLPFYAWSRRAPYGQQLVPFDNNGDDGDGGNDGQQGRRHQRLHILRRCAREDPGIFVAGRSLIPARHAQPTRQRLYRPAAVLPDWH